VNTATPVEAPSGSLTYEPYFGLREKPFSLSSDPRFLYTGPSHVPAFDQLRAGIRRREGLIVLSGEIGTGKTTLCRGVLGALDRRTFTTFVRDPFLSREDLLKTLLIDFGVMSIEDLKSGRLSGATRPDLSYPLYEFLDSLVPLQAFAVLIIDEAQNLSPSLLEEIRILSELESREKLLQVVLVGQPELRSNLKLPQLRQVDQRVSVRCELSPLPVQEVQLYIAHRLHVASGGDAAVEFTSEAARLVWRASRGVPRVVNLICDRALHRAFGARVAIIDAAIVFAAVEDLGRSVEPEDSPSSTPPPPAAPERSLAAAARISAKPSPVVVPVTEQGEARRLAEDGGRLPFSGPVLRGIRSEPADPLAEFSHEADLRRPYRRWLRALLMGAAALVVLAGGGLWYAGERFASQVSGSAVSSLPGRPVLDLGASVREDAAAAAPEDRAAHAATRGLDATADEDTSAPGAAPYAIQVASFQTRTRALRLLDELTTAGYHAEIVEIDSGPRGMWWQIMVGRYSNADEAEADLAMIRGLPSYSDAHVVVLSAE
jgi:type II secretory pathway predicted ATPase ExeA